MSEFEKWVFNNLRTDAPSFKRDFELSKQIWQAATAVSDKRIAELKEKLSWENAVNKGFMESQDRMGKTIIELQSHINYLRDAAENYILEGESTLPALEKALSKTPAQSLQAFENEVIEKCAKVCDELNSSKENTDDWTITRDLAFYRAAEAIRALKGGV